MMATCPTITLACNVDATEMFMELLSYRLSPLKDRGWEYPSDPPCHARLVRIEGEGENMVLFPSDQTMQWAVDVLKHAKAWEASQ